MKRTNIEEVITRRVQSECRQCSSKERDTHKENGCCPHIRSVVDGLPVRCVGSWATTKIYYLYQYLGIFAEGMGKKWKNNLYYIELCSGPGRCCDRNQSEHDGTALMVLKHPKFGFIKKAVFVDYDGGVTETLSKRIEALDMQEKAIAIQGDYNKTDTILDALDGLGSEGLSLCLIDPTDCSVPLETVKAIYDNRHGKCDFIISYFDGVDINRNISQVVRQPEKFRKVRQKYERFLGTDKFFKDSKIQDLASRDAKQELRSAFHDLYKNQLTNIGLSFQSDKQIRSDGDSGPLFYELFFASGNQRGLDFWREATRYTPSGQSLLFENVEVYQ